MLCIQLPGPVPAVPWRLDKAESFAKSLAISDRHDIVQDRIDGGRTVIETARDVVHYLVNLPEIRGILRIDVEQPLSVKRSPAHKESDDHGNCRRK